MKAKIDRDMTGDRKKAKCTPVKPEACSDPDATSVMPREKPDLVQFHDLCRHLQFSWGENCFDRYQASIEACTPEEQGLLKSIRDRKVNSESNAAYGYRRCGETRAVQQCWDQVRLLQRLQFSKTERS